MPPEPPVTTEDVKSNNAYPTVGAKKDVHKKLGYGGLVGTKTFIEAQNIERI